MGKPLEFYTLPLGTRLVFLSTRHNTIEVILREQDPEGENVRFVTVVRTPTALPARMMLVATPPGTDVTLTSDVFRAAIPTISINDKVFLIHENVLNGANGFTVARVYVV